MATVLRPIIRAPGAAKMTMIGTVLAPAAIWDLVMSPRTTLPMRDFGLKSAYLEAWR